MTENLTVDRKIGCEKYSLDSCILVKASVEAISKIIRQYFGLQVYSNCQLIDYVNSDRDSMQELDRQQRISRSNPQKILPPILDSFPFWQYLDRQWAILPFFRADAASAFAFASLLGTDVIYFYQSPHAVHREFRVFRQDRLIEKYLFGLECGEIIPNDWDTNIDNISNDFYWRAYEHHFTSSIRTVDESEIMLAFLSRIDNGDDRGFLDRCLKSHGAYLPLIEETPYCYEAETLDLQQWDSLVERLDIAIGSWEYFDRTIPSRVA